MYSLEENKKMNETVDSRETAKNELRKRITQQVDKHKKNMPVNFDELRRDLFLALVDRWR